MKIWSFLLVGVLIGSSAFSQTASNNFRFLDYQRSFPRISEAMKRKEDTLMKQFKEKNLPWPIKSIYLRSFKYDSQLEVWVRNERNEPYKLFKTYKVCAMAGTLGPKRMQGDYQVPEGFYYINEFNPKSNYHLSLGLNYPNSSDRILGDSLQPGGDIYIHGSCVTTGCIPITDQQIEELYILAAMARTEGQDFIPVHIFPVQFKNKKSNEFLVKYLKQYPEYVSMSNELKHAYYYFEKSRRLPVIMVNKNGDYLFDGPVIDDKPEPAPVVEKKPERARAQFAEEELAKTVEKLPVYPEGQKGFQQYLEDLSRQMVSYLDKGQSRTYILIEFIIDKKGKPAYARVLQGGNEVLNNKLELAFESMPAWTPAVKGGQPTAIRLKQSMAIER
ncbi:MAG TPA: L,D-transpeptidase family protein [Flavitalea sp.]|nr:L,D-transpeptidase family protein [Flavitalea sp.]